LMFLGTSAWKNLFSELYPHECYRSSETDESHLPFGQGRNYG
jgi:hypothetical protein